MLPQFILDSLRCTRNVLFHWAVFRVTAQRRSDEAFAFTGIDLYYTT
jgi:hypothetical protein